MVKSENGKIWKRHVNQLRLSEQDLKNKKAQNATNIFDYSNTDLEKSEINSGGERLGTELNDTSTSTTVHIPLE